MSIQRYECAQAVHGCPMVADERGEYVKYEDHQREVARLGAERDEALAALLRLWTNAQRIFDRQPVRDWSETLAEAGAVLAAREEEV